MNDQTTGICRALIAITAVQEKCIGMIDKFENLLLYSNEILSVLNQLKAIDIREFEIRYAEVIKTQPSELVETLQNLKGLDDVKLREMIESIVDSSHNAVEFLKALPVSEVNPQKGDNNVG